MSKQLKLSVAEPCHENWNGMSPVEKGRFCGSCQKQVVDFSNMSDRQVAEFFKKPSSGSVCGRFMSDQLERPIAIPRKRVPWLKFMLGFFLPVFFAIKGSAQKIGKVAVGPSSDTTRIPVNHEIRTLGLVMPEIKPVFKDTTKTNIKGEIAVIEEIKLRGRLMDAVGQPVPFANILISGTQITSISREDGTFDLSLADGRDSLILQATCVGYLTGQKIVMNKDLSKEVIIVMEENTTEVVAGLVVVCAVPKKPNKVSEIPAIVKSSSQKILIFPNPISSGSACTIDVKMVPASDYELQWLTTSGSIQSRSQLHIVKGQKTVVINSPLVKQGQYFIVLRDVITGKSFSQSVVIN